METSAYKKYKQPPARRGFSLGWRLAISTATIITLVMGGISVSQQMFDLRSEEAMHREFLQNALAPLTNRLENARSLEEMRELVMEFHQANQSLGASEHRVLITDATGARVMSAESADPMRNTQKFFGVSLPVSSPLIAGGHGAITLFKNNGEYRARVARKWAFWAVHLVLTVFVVSVFLATAMHFQVTKPVNRLIRGIRKMERGYWGPVEPGGAWEIRWLAWRFSNMANEVRNTANRLSRAERRAWSLMDQRPANQTVAMPISTALTEVHGTYLSDSSMFQRLKALCERLESASPSDSEAVSLARTVSGGYALDAGRFGFYELKARMEDAALRLDTPEYFAALSGHIDELRSKWGEWASRQRNVILEALERRGIPCIKILHRVKHTAGVHEKMCGKDLDLDEIHDLFAFRIIVPTRADCYAALGVVHQLYEAEASRFKDYIVEPKENGYQALHTCVQSYGAPLFEVQIRSVVMDRHAERGDAVHWQYKANQSGSRKSLLKAFRWGARRK